MKSSCFMNEARQGQAVVEMIVGLVALVVLLAGMLQVLSLALTHTEVMTNARREAGLRAMLDAGDQFVVLSGAKYIRDWYIGRDGKPFTPDDLHDNADPALFRGVIVDKAAADSAGWEAIDRAQNAVTVLRQSENAVSCLGLVKGSEKKPVELIPAVRDLIYRAHSLDVQSDVYMTWRKGIY